jgi:hypothetical protein
MNLNRASSEIESILRQFEERVTHATSSQRRRLAEQTKAALQKVRKSVLHELSEKQVTRTPIRFVRYYAIIHRNSQVSLMAKLDQKIRKALERIEERLGQNPEAQAGPDPGDI